MAGRGGGCLPGGLAPFIGRLIAATNWPANDDKGAGEFYSELMAEGDGGVSTTEIKKLLKVVKQTTGEAGPGTQSSTVIHVRAVLPMLDEQGVTQLVRGKFSEKSIGRVTRTAIGVTQDEQVDSMGMDEVMLLYQCVDDVCPTRKYSNTAKGWRKIMVTARQLEGEARLGMIQELAGLISARSRGMPLGSNWRRLRRQDME